MQDENTPVRIVGVLIEDHTELTLADLTGACAVEIESIVALVDEGIVEPAGDERGQWRFSGAQLRRAATALRLQRDLGVTPAGAALVLDLLDEVDRLRARLRALEG